jgi:hypothetical protein
MLPKKSGVVILSRPFIDCMHAFMHGPITCIVSLLHLKTKRTRTDVTWILYCGGENIVLV